MPFMADATVKIRRILTAVYKRQRRGNWGSGSMERCDRSL